MPGRLRYPGVKVNVGDGVMGFINFRKTRKDGLPDKREWGALNDSGKDGPTYFVPIGNPGYHVPSQRTVEEMIVGGKL